MKRIENRRFDEIAESVADYARLARQVLDHPPGPQGFRPDDMRLVLRIMDRLAAAGPEIVLEDAEHARLLAAIEAYPWPRVHKEIVAFIDAVREAPEVRTRPEPETA